MLHRYQPVLHILSAVEDLTRGSPAETGRARRAPALRFGIGFAVAILLLEVASRVFGGMGPEPLRWYDAVAQEKIDQMDRLGHADIVFIGTSMAWQAFVPSEFTATDAAHRSGYNAALVGGVPQVMQRWTLEEVVPRLEPSTVVWGLSSLDLAPGFGETSVTAYESALATRRGALADIERFGAARLGLVRYRPTLRSPASLFGGSGAKELDESYAEVAEVLAPDGGHSSFEENTSEELAAVQRTRLTDFTPDPEDVRAIRQTIAALQSRGIEVVIVELPVPERFVELHPKGATDHTLVGNELSAIADELGVPFIRMATGRNDADFVDFTHLTSQAAAEFTRTLAGALAAGRDDRGQIFAAPDVPSNRAGSSECRMELVLDEYGAEIEVEICEDTDPDDVPGIDPAENVVAPEDRPDFSNLPTVIPGLPGAGIVRAVLPGDEIAPGLTDWLGSAEARALATAIEGRFIGLRGCQDGATPTDLSSFVVPDEAAARALSGFAQAIAAMESRCHTPGWLAEFENVTAHGRALLQALGRTTREIVYGTNEVTERTAEATAVMDNLHVTLLGRADTRSAFMIAAFWESSDIFGVTRQIRTKRLLEDPDYPEVGIIGTSIAAHAFDQNIVAEMSGRSVLNLSGAQADVDLWEELSSVAFGQELPTTILWGITTHRMIVGHMGNCQLSPSEPSVRRSAMFAARPELSDLDPVDVLLGPTVGAPYDVVPIATANKYRNTAVGERKSTNKTFTQMGKNERLSYDSAAFCQSYFDRLTGTLQAFTRAGTRVAMLLIPSHEVPYNLAPDLHDRARAELERISELTGVPLVTVADDLPSELTDDGLHPNRAGRRLYSEWLGKALPGLFDTP